MPMLSLLGANHRLPLFYMDKNFIWLNETKERINYFTIGYMINPGLYVNKTFEEQVEKCMNNKFGEITQPFIKATLVGPMVLWFAPTVTSTYLVYPG